MSTTITVSKITDKTVVSGENSELRVLRVRPTLGGEAAEYNYLGSSDTYPTTSTYGNALAAGDYFIHTGLDPKQLAYYDGSEWLLPHEDATNAQGSETAAQSSEDDAQVSEDNAKVSEDNAKVSETNSANSASSANSSKNAAQSSEDDAKVSEDNAKASENAAAVSQSNADLNDTNSANSASSANSSKNAAQSSEDDAQISEDNAKVSEDNSAASEAVAIDKANIATTKANDASNSSSSASTFADNAEASKNQATTQANTATTKASEAANSASQAASSATAAQSAESSAQSAKTDAETAETNAETAENAAELAEAHAEAAETSSQNSQAAASASQSSATASANSASNSANDAQSSEDDASTSESNAANSATASANSATASSTSANSSSDSATTATNKANTATTKANEASSSATTATNKANTATTKADEASSSETNAANSASAASSSASAASSSASQASGYATDAENSFNEFDNIYLGAKNSAPTQDNDGGALEAGMVYWLRAVGGNPGKLNVYGNGSWQEIARVVNGTTSEKGIVQLNTATNSTSTTLAATPSAVKIAYDKGNQALTAANSAQSSANSAQTTANAALVEGTGSSQGRDNSQNDLRFLGIGDKADDSDKLDGLNSSQFLRSDNSDTLTGNLTITGQINTQQDHVINRRFFMIQNASPQYILLCLNAGSNDVNGHIRMDRTSGNHQAVSLDVVVSGSNANIQGGSLICNQVVQENENYKLVTVTHDAVNYVAIEYTGNTYPETIGAFFTGRIVSTGSSLDVVSTGVSEIAVLSLNSRVNFNTNEVQVNGISVIDADGNVDASTLGGVNSTQFLRSDEDDTVNGRITINGGSSTIGGSSFDDGHFKIGNSTTGMSFDTNEIYATDTIIIGSFSGGLTLLPANGIATVSGSRIFTDTYHPNADSLTTARTISLSGDASGSVSFDGSGNVSIPVSVTNDSHTHDGRYYTEAESNARFLGINDKADDSNLLDGINSSSFLRSDTADTATGKITFSTGLARDAHNVGHLEGSYNNVSGNGAKTNPIYTIGSSYNPSTETLDNMYGIGFANSDGTSYLTGDLDAGGTGWGMYVASGGIAKVFLNAGLGTITSTGQHYAAGDLVWNAGNDGSGSGLDADTVDGIQASQFLRNDVANQTIYNSGTNNALNVLADDAYEASINAIGTSQGTGVLYVGQSGSHGGGIFYNGDGSPEYATGDFADHVSFFRRSGNTNHVVFEYGYSSNNVSFRGDITAATLNGNATSATKLATSRDITLVGNVSGVGSFDGSGNISIPVSVANDSHTHDGRYFTEAESDARFLGINGNATSATKLNTARTISLSGDASGSVSFDGSGNANIPVTVSGGNQEWVLKWSGNSQTISNSWGSGEYILEVLHGFGHNLELYINISGKITENDAQVASTIISDVFMGSYSSSIGALHRYNEFKSIEYSSNSNSSASRNITAIYKLEDV
jgi:hypothetical protein